MTFTWAYVLTKLPRVYYINVTHALLVYINPAEDSDQRTFSASRVYFDQCS